MVHIGFISILLNRKGFVMMKWIIMIVLLVAAAYGAYWIYKQWKNIGSAINPG